MKIATFCRNGGLSKTEGVPARAPPSPPAITYAAATSRPPLLPGTPASCSVPVGELESECRPDWIPC